MSQNRVSTGNFYSVSRTPSPSSGSTSRRTSPNSTPPSSRDHMPQLISGLAACQKSIEELLQAVRNSNERIEELADKVKTLDSKVEKLSSQSADDTERWCRWTREKEKENEIVSYRPSECNFVIFFNTASWLPLFCRVSITKFSL